MPRQDPGLGWSGRGRNRTRLQNSHCIMKGMNASFSHDDFLKFSIVNHLLDHIKAAYELPLDDELRKRWPVVVGFQAWLS